MDAAHRFGQTVTKRKRRNSSRSHEHVAEHNVKVTAVPFVQRVPLRWLIPQAVGASASGEHG